MPIPALVPGQLVDVVVELADIPGAIVVPREAVNNGPDGTFVYAVKPDRSAVVSAGQGAVRRRRQRRGDRRRA